MRSVFPALVLAIVGQVLVPAAGSAETIIYTGMGLRSTANVTLEGGFSRTVYAGEINWTWSGGTPEGFASSFYSYCVDLQNLVVNPQEVTIRSTTEMADPNAASKAAWLFNTYASAVHAGGNHYAAAALQLAIWEALYDSTNSLTSGVFRVNSVANNQITTFAQEYLLALYSAPGGYSMSTAVWLDAKSGQDQVTAVDEPGAPVLTAFAALLLIGWRRRATT